MRYLLLIIGSMTITNASLAQKMTIAQMKAGLEKAANPVAYTREILKKKYKIDTVVVMSTTKFIGMADSLAYTAKLKKVYGPIEKKYLVMVLGRAPNRFNRLSQIFIDTSTFRRRIADSLANSIISNIKTGKTNFEDMAQAYSMGGEAATKGDLGWIAQGSVLPEIEKELARRKKGEVFKIWTRTGVHVVKRTADPKEDTGFALLLRVFL